MLAPEKVAVYQTQREIRYPRTPPYYHDYAYQEYILGLDARCYAEKSAVSREEIRCASNDAAWSGRLQEFRETLDFERHFGWKGHIESPSRLGQADPTSAS